ncbi:hypothetical protein C882_1821 [Caenispirillum salinarum AK4]|uniref:Uncharacterized protein n=1 Tax=Caenispirillum salinarum AK4 TaxID=1238182 RepID=K9GRF4_9PROT|nr:hypothetical protein C882_1821 [Caenispirillum salinarum AK4]
MNLFQGAQDSVLNQVVRSDTVARQMQRQTSHRWKMIFNAI